MSPISGVNKVEAPSHFDVPAANSAGSADTLIGEHTAEFGVRRRHASQTIRYEPHSHCARTGWTPRFRRALRDVGRIWRRPRASHDQVTLLPTLHGTPRAQWTQRAAEGAVPG